MIGNIFRGDYKIEGNNLIISSDNLGINRDAFACKAFERNINEGIQYVQKTTYYTIVKEVLGEKWLTNKWFRMGTSRLANLLLSEIVGEETKFF